VIVMKRFTGKRTTSAAYSGFTSAIPVSVPANSQGSARAPDATAISSRIGRRMK
jgi:hypothetical protein